ncbi:THO complex subunit 5A [Argentina anserina]|uniref:THO complex subunit 5A n=1 Tax=Argentina anserina TaxID=57926 RepID=UPI0021765C2B|nr:THO complex subunit 5A [Potentilla anserina]
MEDEEIEEGMLVEEEAAPPRPEKSPYEVLRETKSSVEDVVAKMLSVKKEGRPKSELHELVTQMFLNFVTLRQANRSILLEEERVKSETESAKAPVDLTTLQLHNLMYEKSHYVKAIKACKDFKSKYPDIDLVPEEDFFRDAPANIKEPALSNDAAQDLMLKRLNFELHQRKELCELSEKLEVRKKGLQETIANRKKFLNSLPSHLKSLKKASLPVQNQFGNLHTKKLKQLHSAELLPPPLYVVYSQFSAQKEAFGEQIDLEIVGSVKDAQAFAHQQANRDTGVSTNGETSRLEDDAPDEDDEGQRRRKRPKRAPSKQNLDQSGVYQVHPFKVILHIFDDESSDPKSAKLVTLKFEYLLKLNVVCVGVEGSHEAAESNILCNLFPDDTGLELPHQSAKLIVDGTPAFDEKRTARPYKWAQHLAGIDFLPEVSPLLSVHDAPTSDITKTDAVISGLSLYRQQNRVQTVVRRVRSRKKAQMALVVQLESLMKLKWPALSFESVPWALHAPLCKLHGCSPVGAEPSSLSAIDKEQVQEPMDTDSVGRYSSSKEELESMREDGELPSLVQVASVSDDKLVQHKGDSRRLSLLSKRPPVSKARPLSYKRHTEELDFLLDTESDVDEPTHLAPEEENGVPIQCFEVAGKAWVDYGTREFRLVLTRNIDSGKGNVKLEAKIKISMEYPLRPPFFTLSLCTMSRENHYESDDSELYNELRAMEAEVNLHIVKMLSQSEENNVLGHQVCCLAMLFDYYMDEASPSSEKRKSTSVVDVGLCKPVIGQLITRSYRGRDRRKMISWKDMECAPGYPY